MSVGGHQSSSTFFTAGALLTSLQDPRGFCVSLDMSSLTQNCAKTTVVSKDLSMPPKEPVGQTLCIKVDVERVDTFTLSIQRLQLFAHSLTVAGVLRERRE